MAKRDYLCYYLHNFYARDRILRALGKVEDRVHMGLTEMLTKPDAIPSANIGGVNNVALSDKPNINVVEATELSTFELEGRCQAKVARHQIDISTILAIYSKRLKRSGYDEVISAQELNIRFI